jgi:hypothetical protein
VIGPVLGGGLVGLGYGLHAALIAAAAVAIAGALLTAAFIPGKSPASASPRR